MPQLINKLEKYFVPITLMLIILYKLFMRIAIILIFYIEEVMEPN